MLQTICKIAILVASGLLIAAPVSPVNLNNLTGITGLIILFSSLPALSGSYKKPTFVFLILSLFLFVKFELSFGVLVGGVNSMLAIAAIVAVLQVFAIPLKLGNYDQALQRYLQVKYKRQISLYVFLSLITHVLGSFMLFGSVPMLVTIFQDSLKKMVPDYKRFLASALSRSFSLVTLWGPGTVNVVLVLEVTGVKWLYVLLPAVFLAFLGLLTSVLLEAKLHLKDQAVLAGDHAAAEGYPESVPGADEVLEADEGKGKIRSLVLISLLLIAAIFVMENQHILTGTTRVIAAGLAIALVWIWRYRKRPGLASAWQTYWDNSILVARDLAALFIAMGIFAEAVNQAGLISYLQSGLNSGVAVFGPYSFLLIPPLLILLSLVGIHPFISTMLIGKIFVSIIQIPNYEILIALSLLLGSVISFVLSPFAGNVLTISRMLECSPQEVSYKWNGLFSLVFFLEAIAFFFILKAWVL
ncbi:MAG: hypothetical protein RBT41_07810 [Clostridia bacterium]|jgi:hypothetical protein|nr:hypothetical protein [Clostridia bacterium]